MSAAAAEVGIIGGSGLYDFPGLEKTRELRLRTPFGHPSAPYRLGVLEGRRVAFLARHGIGHRLLPSEINFRANVHGFRQLGVSRLVSASAVGSMKPEIEPLHLVVPDQMVDRTVSRPATFFGDGVVAHVALADPFCADLRQALSGAARRTGARTHEGGTYLCIEGPQFSTRAESRLYRSWGVDVIGMTNLPEARLAREAELCYATLALVTDYDCWHESGEDVTVEAVLSNLRRNAETAVRALRETVRELPAERRCACGSALSTALITQPPFPPAARRRLGLLLGRFLEPGPRSSAGSARGAASRRRARGRPAPPPGRRASAERGR
jgi:5'-methylthioadenosine phosphorylase